ncbi:hypothetical protein SLEP1_g18616 [Rubroshorea leprosula]|uniref:Uncharacterized protein n=1 Tax=Rubroshorea leprosula TaxID=152421 RepID=A0AAV5IY21_9ROSI|nr:hypothetical protein SLEP1_g18616 [Rubroshorea leprosula]
MAAELILGPVADATVSRVIVAASEQINLVWGWKDDLKRFRLIMSMLGGVLQDADEKHITGHFHLRAWLEELQAIVDKADDMLEEVAYHNLRRRVVFQAVADKADDVLEDVAYHNLRRQVAFLKSNWKKVSYLFTPSSHHPLVFRVRMSNKVKNLNIHLADICDWATRMGLQYKISNSRVPMPIGNQYTNSFLAPTDPSKPFGREKDVDKIVGWLTDDSSNEEALSVISIWGMPGLGKSTLAKAVCENENIKKYFGKKIMWVSVSVNFDVERILGEMLESLTRTPCTLKNDIDTLVKETSGALEKMEKEEEEREKRESEGTEGEKRESEGKEGEKREKKRKSYLLILDDVWNEEWEQWDELSRRLLSIRENLGKRVVVTTRSAKVVSTMRTRKEHVLHLGQLEGDACWDIIKERAGNAFIDKGLEKIGKKIGEKCGGSPLAAAVLGGSLCNNRDRGDWSSVESKMGALSSLEDQPGRIMHALQLSFDQLPKLALKRCFAFCSIFPRAFVMKRDVLIQLWMAEGYLQPSMGNSVEDVGTKYFNDLLSYSLFLEEERDDLGNVKSCKMHDLIHDLVKSVSKFETMIFNGGSGSNVSGSRSEVSISDQVQRLNLIHGVPNNLGDVASKVCTLFSNHGFSWGRGATKFKRLRVLSFCDASDAKQLPTCFENSKSLRYLDISGTQMEELPKFITKLYNLQTFRFMNCKSLKMPPRGIGDLINLSHIYFSDEERMPANLGRLASLQTLPLFFVGATGGRKIEELGSLRELKGRLEIHKLELVTSKSEAEKAKLKDKAVEHLELCWSEGKGNQDEGKVLEGLQPPSNMRRLRIAFYGGGNLAPWMSSLNNLVDLVIISCKMLQEIPDINRLLSLQRLHVYDCDELTSLGADDGDGASTSLKQLSISRCGKLEEGVLVGRLSSLEELEIWDCKVINSIGDNLSSFTCLKRLCLKRCPKLQSIPSLKGLVSLKTVDVNDCDELQHLSSEPSSCTTLEVLDIRNCSNLVSVLEELKELRSLVELHIQMCPKLKSIPSLEGSISLKEVFVYNCNELECIPSGLSSCTALEELKIQKCSNLVSIPRELKQLKSLVKLAIWFCPKLKFIPSLEGLVSLKNVVVYGCNELEHRPSGLSSCTVSGLSSCTATALEELEIGECFNLFSIPEELKQLRSLVKLKILHCSKLKFIPSLEGFVSLKTVEVGQCDKLKYLPKGLSSCTALEKLAVQSCSNLVSIPKKLKQLRSLVQLHIWYCRKLRSFPKKILGSLASLRTLRLGFFSKELEKFPDLSSTSVSLEVLVLSGWGNVTLPHQIQHLTALRDLTIERFNGVKDALLGNLYCLEKLSFKNCPNLVSFQAELKELHSLTVVGCPNSVGFLKESLGCCTRLKRLEIGRFSEELEEFPSLSSIPASLEDLTLRGWGKLTHLPQIQHLTALEELNIFKFSGMESLPDWFNNLSSLRRLYITDCPNKLKERCTEGSGPDWPKISHIPYCDIYPIQSQD